MNKRAISFIKNFSYILASNLVSLVVSALVVVIVPKLIGVAEYGFWQLYLFYSSYVGFLHFGWNDGIYLRYGGKDYQDLDKKLFFSQFYMLVFLELIIAFVITIISIVILQNRMFILQMTALCLLATNVRFMLLYILQCTNRIKEYAQITILDKIIYCCLIIVLLLIGVREYKLMVAADLVGRFISLLYAMHCCRDMVFNRISAFYFSIKETIENISVGIKLMFANIASMLIIGIVRFGIERCWSIATFGKVSLTLNVSSIIMLFINAVGTIMFPILRRTDEAKLPSIYLTMRDFLMVILLGALLIYYPFQAVLSAWLPQYADSLIFMALLFPMCIYEGKTALLINTYLNTLRKEKIMLKINLATMSLSLFITLVTTRILMNLDLAIVSIVILLAFRSLLAEIYLSKILQISIIKDIVFELALTIIFILSGWFINSWYTSLIYGIAYLGYLLIKKHDIKNRIFNFKLLLRTDT